MTISTKARAVKTDTIVSVFSTSDAALTLTCGEQMIFAFGDDQTRLGGEFIIPPTGISEVTTSTNHGDKVSILQHDNKALKFKAGGELDSIDTPFTESGTHGRTVLKAHYSSLLKYRGSFSREIPDQLLPLSFGDDDAEQNHQPSSDVPSDAMPVSSKLFAVPNVRDSAISPLASALNVRDLSAYPALHALSIPNATVRVDMRAAEYEAAMLRYREYDPELIARIVGTHRPSSITTYNNHMNGYARFAASMNEPPAPPTAYVLSQYLWHLAERTTFPQIKNIRDAISACAGMVGLESATSDLLVKMTMKAIGKKIGRRHDGRAMPLIAPDLRKAQPWLESLEQTEPDRALVYRLILSFGIATMARRIELVSIKVEDLVRTHFGYTLTVPKTKTYSEQEPPHYIHIQRIHDQRICPVRLLDAYLKRFSITSGLLFRRIRVDGSPGLSALSAQRLSLIVREVAFAAGLEKPEKFSGHSLRSGGINSAHGAGQTLDQIRAVSLQADPESTYRYINSSSSIRPLTSAIFS